MRRDWLGHRRIGDGVGHGRLFEARQRDDVARLRFVHRHAVQPVEGEQLGRAARFHDVAVRIQRADRIVDAHLARLDAAGQHAAHEVVAIQQRGEEGERAGRIEAGGGDVVGDHLEQRLQRAVARAVVFAGIAVAAAGVEHREVQLLVVGIEADEQVEHLVQHGLRATVRPVDLVDDDDGLQAQRQRLAGDELGLRHRSLGAVHQQNDAIDHGQDALHLGAEIGVAGRVDDVDARRLPVVLPLHAGALGEDGDAALLLQVAGVHRAFLHALVLAEGAGLAEQLVDQRGLAVIDVGDDGDIAQGL